MTPMWLPQTSAGSPWLPTTARIEEVVAETPGVATYRLRIIDGERAANYRFHPGQFNMLYLPGWGEVAISLSGPTRLSDQEMQSDQAMSDTFDLLHTIREVGLVTRAIAQRTIGDCLALRGPFGRPWPVKELEGGDVVLVAGGIGLAPLRPVVYELLARRERFGRCVLLMGARTVDNLLYEREFAAWSAGGLEVQTTVDRPAAGWSGNVGVVSLLLDRLRLRSPEDTRVLMCGPEVMMRFVASSARGRGVAASQIWVSLERHMQCAIGLCGHCQLGTELLCRDGPVFRWDRVEPLLQIHDL